MVGRALCIACMSIAQPKPNTGAKILSHQLLASVAIPEPQAGTGGERAVREAEQDGAEEEEEHEAAEAARRELVRDVEDVLGQREAETDHASVDSAVERAVELAETEALARAIRDTPRPLKPSSKIGAKTVAPMTSMSFGEASSSALVMLDAIEDVIPPPSVAKMAPHTKATPISHHGSGSKRSAQRMTNRYVSTSGVTKMTRE